VLHKISTAPISSLKKKKKKKKKKKMGGAKKSAFSAPGKNAWYRCQYETKKFCIK
jgi:hypothetical protein